jgi:hypothetical protein
MRAITWRRAMPKAHVQKARATSVATKSLTGLVWSMTPSSTSFRMLSSIATAPPKVPMAVTSSATIHGFWRTTRRHMIVCRNSRQPRRIPPIRRMGRP